MRELAVSFISLCCFFLHFLKLASTLNFGGDTPSFLVVKANQESPFFQAYEPNGFSRKIGCNSRLAFFVSGPERISNGFRTDPERTPNGSRTDPERTPRGPHADLRGPCANPERTLNGPRADPERTPNGPRTDPGRSQSTPRLH